MITWPNSLVREIANRRVVIFLGSGVSATSVDAAGGRPLTWMKFLEQALGLVANIDNRNLIQQLITDKNYLLALQAISDETDAGDYRDLLDTNFNNPNFQASKLHDLILKLDARIVITTNFDKIYESYCESSSKEGYKIVSYTSTDLGDLLRSDTRVIVKAHGSINDIDEMIFTRSQYHQAKRDNPQFYELLKAIFLTNTCIFIGCGMDDPDLLLTLEEVKITASTTRPHYVLVKEGKHDQYAAKELREAYNINALIYGPKHDNLVIDIEELHIQVESARYTGSGV